MRIPALLSTVLTAVLLAAIAPQYIQAQGSSVFSPKRLNPLPVERQMHGSAVVGDRLYLIGGGAEEWTNSVISAKILEDGSLSPWREEIPLPENRHYLSEAVEVINDRIYIMGGLTAPQPNSPPADIQVTDSVIYTRVKADGTLEPWKISEPFKTGRMANSAACASEKHLYVTGGTDTGNVTHTRVVMADIDPDSGAPVNVRHAASLPVSLWFHGAAIMENRMFIWGGLTQRGSDSVSSGVYVADLDSNGVPQVWRQTTSLPQGIYSCAFSGFNDYLISIAGRYVNGMPTNDIWYARVENGEAKTWNRLQTDLDARLYHSLGLDRTRGWIFINGGRHRTQPNLQGPSHLVKEVAGFRLGAGEGSSQAKAVATALPSLNAALQKARTTSKPVLVYFYSSDVPACDRFQQSVLQPQISKLQQQYEIAAVDSSKDSSSSYKYSVFRVPSMAILNPDGTLKKSSSRLQTTQELTEFLK